MSQCGAVKDNGGNEWLESYLQCALDDGHTERHTTGYVNGEFKPDGWLSRPCPTCGHTTVSAPCRFCSGEIGPDVTCRPMCYGCGPTSMAPPEKRRPTRFHLDGGR